MAPGVQASSSAASPAAELDRALEALLFVSLEPLTVKELANLIAVGESKVRGGLRRLTQFYVNRGIHIEKHGGGYRFAVATRAEHVVAAYRMELAALSEEAYEVLALVAYLQPITAPQLAEHRDEDATHVLQTLQEAGLIEVALGEDGELFFRTTAQFLEDSALSSLDDLPLPLIWNINIGV